MIYLAGITGDMWTLLIGAGFIAGMAFGINKLQRIAEKGGET